MWPKHCSHAFPFLFQMHTNKITHQTKTFPLLRQSDKFTGVRVYGREVKHFVALSRAGKNKQIVDNSDKKIEHNSYKIPSLNS